MLALVPHPARVAEAGGVDTAAGETGAGPLARLGLGHLRVERQVEEAIAEEPVVPIQQPGRGAPAAARRPSPTEPRGRRLLGASVGRAPRLHLAQRPCPPGLCLRARTGMLLSGNPAGDNRAPPAPLLLLLFTGGCPSPAPRSGGTDPNRVRLHSAPSSRTRASPLRRLTLSSAGRAHRRGVPGRAGGGERAARAARGALEGTCGRGPAGRGGDPARGPASPAARANCLGSQPRAGRAGASWSPGWARPTREGEVGKRGSAAHRPACGWRPPSSHFLSRASGQSPGLRLKPAGRCTRACPRSPASRLPTISPQAQRRGLAPS